MLTLLNVLQIRFLTNNVTHTSPTLSEVFTQL